MNFIKGYKGYVQGQNICHTCEIEFDWKFPDDNIDDGRVVALTVVYDNLPDFTGIEKLDKDFTVFVKCKHCSHTQEFHPVHYWA
jgi:hypothetical protein